MMRYRLRLTRVLHKVTISTKFPVVKFFSERVLTSADLLVPKNLLFLPLQKKKNDLLNTPTCTRPCNLSVQPQFDYAFIESYADSIKSVYLFCIIFGMLFSLQIKCLFF